MKAVFATLILSFFAFPLLFVSGGQDKASGVSAAGTIEGILQSATAEAAVSKFREIRSAPAGRYEFKESEFNTLGYRMIRQARPADAVRVFEMNVEMFPASAGVYDSLSAGYLYLGKRDKAEEVLRAALRRENAEKSFLELLSRSLRDLDDSDWQIRSETRDVVRFPPGRTTGLRGPFLGQDPPGDEPKLFAPGIASTLGYNDFCASFSPDGNELVFSRGMTIMVSRLEAEGWTAPEPAAFNGGYRSHLAHLAFDNKRVFFCGSRPPQPYGIWMAERAPGGWSESRRMWDGMYATTAKSGNIYFGVESDTGAGVVRTHASDGGHAKPEALILEADGPKPERVYFYHPAVDPDERFLVFDDNKMLRVSFRNADGSWGPAVSLGGVLGARMATIPSISPDGRYLFFSSHFDLYWVSTRVLEKVRGR